MAKDRKDMGYLGEDFQYRLVHEFISDKDFFSDLYDILDQNMFTDPNLKTVVGVMKEHYAKYESVPSYAILKQHLFERAKNDIEHEYYNEVVDKIHHSPTDGIEYTRDLAFKFFKQQNIIKTANEILRIAGNGDVEHYDRCVELLNNTLNAGERQDLGSKPFDNEEEVLSDDYRITIPTGIGKIDETLEGGLGKGELGAIVGPSSFGKAQPLDARILTPNGYKLMGEIKIGDNVIGRDGHAHKVIGVFPQGVRPIYKVTFSNGTSCECDIEHLWDVNSYYQRSGKKYIRGKSKNANDKYYSPDKSFKTLTLREIIEKGFVRRNNRYNFRVPVVKPIEFESQYVSFDPYMVGYYIGDGCFSRCNITVGVDDYDNAHQNLTLNNKEYFSERYYAKRNIWTFNINGNLKKRLLEKFDPKIKSHDKVIPNEYIFNTIENRVSLLQGIMDSDGSSNRSNGSCEFCSKSKKLAEQVQFIVRSLGGFASITESDSKYFSKKLNRHINCGKRYRVTISLCDNSLSLFRLNRKQERVRYRTRNSECLYMTGAEYIGDKEAKCIMVDSEEHLYVTEDFIVTHNTSLTTAIAAYAATYRCEQNNNDGFKVLQLVFEDRIKQIQRKHFGRITGVEAKDLSKADYIDYVKDQLANYEDRELLQNNLRIVRWPSGERSAWDVEKLIKRLKNNGFSPDLVIVDYFECLANKRGSLQKDDWSKEAENMRKFESMAGELNIAFWIPIQGTRDSVNAELVTMDKAGGSFKKIQIAHIVMTIARTVEDIESNIATVAILKNRAGQSGKIFNNVEFNNGTCRISTDHVAEYASMAMYNKEKDKQMLETQRDIFLRSVGKSNGT